MNQHSSMICRYVAVLLLALILIVFAGCSKSRALHDAIQRGDLEKAKVLLKSHPDLVSSRDRNGEMPLEFAAMFGHKDMVELLLASHAEVNAKDTVCGRTPLHYAWTKSVAELLLANKAEVDAKGKDGETPLYMAVIDNRIEVAELLLTHGADVNAKIDNGWTPLHVAQNKETTELLLAHGANVNAKDNEGYTPLRHAMAYDFKDIAESLRQHGGRE